MLLRCHKIIFPSLTSTVFYDNELLSTCVHFPSNASAFHLMTMQFKSDAMLLNCLTFYAHSLYMV